MSTLPPVSDRDNNESRRHAAMARIRRSIEAIECQDDPDILEHIDGLIDDACWEMTHQKRREAPTATGRDSGTIPVALARSLADGTWRRP